MSEEWKKMFKQNYLDEINKLKQKKLLIAFVLIEKFTDIMDAAQILYPLNTFWEFVEEINQLIKD